MTLDRPRPEPICGMDTWMPMPAKVVDVRKKNFNTSHNLSIAGQLELATGLDVLPARIHVVAITVGPAGLRFRLRCLFDPGM